MEITGPNEQRVLALFDESKWNTLQGRKLALEMAQALDRVTALDIPHDLYESGRCRENCRSCKLARALEGK